ncbi:MAG: phosphate ABC transporter permease subunit PstC [Sphaerobacter sp.]|nr:phosphate ABC transporter permease subunit PstC [Sphaerobacter sp.]
MEAGSPGWAARLRRRLRDGDVPFRFLAAAFATVVVALLVAIVGVTWQGSASARAAFGLRFLTGTAWNPVAGQFGALPAIYGTIVSSAIALLLAAPPGIMIGVFLSDLCPQRLRWPLSLMVELLAAIPSVVYGMWGIFVFVPFFRSVIATPVSRALGDTVPLLAGPVSVGRGLLVAGVILAIMILPTIAAVSRDVLAVVPNHQREALLALGATRWEVIRHALLPCARAGIVGAMMLGLGRALGETMAATMVIGNTPRIDRSLFQPASTAASLIASQLPTANTELHSSALVFLALVLFLITLLANSLARLLVWRVAGAAGRSR